ncbi:MAG: secretin and TonB N-terminal domain-containing protein [Acidobacteria bacterium]|nr:secretin and TonB N-terminal domain-containing protein [Acidobacteriota bacterium]
MRIVSSSLQTKGKTSSCLRLVGLGVLVLSSLSSATAQQVRLQPSTSAGRTQPPPSPPLPPLAVTQLEVQQPQGPEQTFSLSFAEPIPVRELLLLVVRDTGISVVPDPNVDGTFLGELKNVTLTQALDLILRPLNLDYSLQDNVIRVFARQLETRIFPINYVATRRSGSRSLGATTGATGAGVGGFAGAGGIGGGAIGGGAGFGGGQFAASTGARYSRTLATASR